LKELKKAYLDARRGKTKKPEVEKFDKVAELEIAALAEEIHSVRIRHCPQRHSL
jgi:hypothetical protein